MDKSIEATVASLLITVLLVLSSLSTVPGAWAQVPGFLYIDCGANASYVDPFTGIEWLPDAGYIATGENYADVPTAQTRWNAFPEVNTLRYFNDSRAKNCYTLPVTINSTYLLRATFLYASYDNAAVPPSFSMAIDETIVANVTCDPAGQSFDILEFTIRPQEHNVTFLCLTQDVLSQSGVPFISSISLRPGPVYPFFDSYLLANQFIRMRYRISFGGSTLGRYPVDKYDRWWNYEGVNTPYLYTQSSPLQNLTSSKPVQINYISTHFGDIGPPAVMFETALTTHSNFMEFVNLFYGDINPNGIFAYMVLYFAEIDPIANATSREFYIRVPSFYDAYENPWNATNTPGPFAATFNIYPDFFFDSASVILLFQNRTSVLGPLINAFEFFEVTGVSAATTIDRDVLAIDAIKLSMNLTEWTGDPCLPIPHAWITCTTLDVNVRSHPQILTINLSGYHLDGPISPNFVNLLNLTSLSLDNNALIGSLPDMSLLTNLKILHLQDNNLTGPIPSWLAMLPNLTELFVENNNLSGIIPLSLLSKNGTLNFRYRPGNPLLRNTSIATSNANNVKSSKKILIIGSSVVGSALVLAFFIILVIRHFYASFNFTNKKGKPQLGGGAKSYSYAEVRAMTNNLQTILGQGGFAVVYHGRLPDGTEVAVKVLKVPQVIKGVTQDDGFFTEVDILSKVHHKYVVSLVGYCQEEDKKILIYEYVSNGTLRSHLHGNVEPSEIMESPKPHEQLDWKTRLSIASTAAQGLDYLHIGCNPSMIHRDIKSENILLTNNLKIAKIADFGLLKLVHKEDATHVTTNPKGTIGYLDPEYFGIGQLTTKSDVYSFGVVLLELITGRPPNDPSNGHILKWVEFTLQGGIDKILDPIVRDSHSNIDSVKRVLNLAFQSLEHESPNRPAMRQIVNELQQAIDIEKTHFLVTQ